MFEKYLELYILKMESIKLIKETIEKNMPYTINKEVNKYKDAMLMDLYFEQLLVGRIDKKIEAYVKKIITVNETDEELKKITYRFNKKGDGLNKLKDIEESRKVLSKSFYTISTMYNNILISIIIEFENIITKIFKEIIVKYPDAYLGSINVSYAEIVKSQDIKHIKEKIISDEVNLIMRESIFEWIKILEKKHKIKISLENQYTQNFIEAYLRRNIIVHNESKINKEYINGMKVIGKNFEEKIIGNKLICTEEYINKIIDSSIYLIIYFINQILILFQEENENFTNYILTMGFEKINNEEYDLARELCRLLKDNKTLSCQLKIYSQINYWQTYKWADKYEEVKNEVDNFDISAYEEVIKLAVYALKDDYKMIENILKYEFNEEKQNEELAFELEEFPVFKQLRKQQFYKDLKELYPDIFNIKSMQIDEETDVIRTEFIKNNKGKFSIKIDIKEETVENKLEINEEKR